MAADRVLACRHRPGRRPPPMPARAARRRFASPRRRRSLATAPARASAVLVRPGRLHHARQPVEARLGEEHRAAVGAELALAEVGVAVAVRAQRRLAVVEVQRADPVVADDGAQSSSTAVSASAVRISKPEASRWQESRHTPRRASPPEASSSARELLEGAPERPARPGGVLEVQRAALALCERLADHLPGALDRRLDVARLRRARHGARRRGAERVARLQRRDERRQRLRRGSPCPRTRS